MAKATSTALVPVSKAVSYSDCKDFALVVAESKMFLNKDITNSQKALALIMIGREMGLGPAASIRGIYMINGVPSLSSRVMASLIKMSGEYDLETIKRENAVAEVAILRKVEGKWIRLSPTCTFTLEDAKRAGLVKPNSAWVGYPRNMCWARAVSDAFGVHCPHLASGLPIYACAEEEIEDNPGRSPVCPRTEESLQVTPGPPDAEFTPCEQPEGFQDGPGKGGLPETDYARMLNLAREKGSSLEAIRQHHQLEHLRDMTPAVFQKIMKVLESK